MRALAAVSPTTPAAVTRAALTDVFSLASSTLSMSFAVRLRLLKILIESPPRP